MKKHNEGYALVLVLVVITVLCLVSMAMTASSLKNLKNQQDSIERMEAKYAAQGEIEKVIAGFEQKIASASSEFQDISIARTPELGAFAGVEADVRFEETQYIDTIDGQKTTDQDYLIISFETTLKDDNGSTEGLQQVRCKIKITGDISKDNQTEVCTVKLANLNWQYVSYTITEGGGS